MSDKIKGIIAKIDLSHTSLCVVDTLIRLDEKDFDNYCRGCVFREEVKMLVCPIRCKYIRGLRVLL
jgi:hypothetical protein